MTQQHLSRKQRAPFPLIPLITLAWAVGVGALSGWGAQSHATEVCPVQFPATAPAQTAHWKLEIERLGALHNSCLSRADYFAYRGQLLLRQRHPKEALESLERSLLLRPDQPGVQLDFAIALAEVGDRGSSRALVRQVLSRTDVPDDVRRVLQNLAQDLGADNPRGESRAAWHTVGALQTLVGHDKNLNNAPHLSSITLTLPNGNFSLPLDSASQAQSGMSLLHSAQLAATRSWGDGVVALNADWRARQVPGHAAYGYEYYQLGASLKPQKSSPWSYRAGLSHYQAASLPMFSGLLLSISHEGRVPEPSWFGRLSCQYRAGLEAESRGYHQDTLLNGVYGGATGTLVCARGAHQWIAQLQLGIDVANAPARVGGNQRRGEIKSQWLYQQGAALWSGELMAGRTLDESAYSSLLGGAVRQATRAHLKLSYSKPVDFVPGLQVVGTVEKSRTQSTIELFNIRGQAAYVGLRYVF